MRLLVLALAACAATPTAGPLGDAALVMQVRLLATPDGRLAGSPDEQAAANAVEGMLSLAGLAVHEQVAAGLTNVYAVLPGRSDELVVVGAHLDHLGPGFPGADDDASGVALVLGVAEALAQQRARLDRSIVFAFFDGEESGMLGSKAFVDDPPIALAKVRAMVNLDVVGRRLQDRFGFAALQRLFGIRGGATGLVGARHYLGLRAIADRAFAGDQLVAAEDLPAELDVEVEAQAEGRSDSASFEAVGIPALFFGDGESRDYHRPTDTVDRLDPALLAARARAVARVVVALADAPATAFARTTATPPRRYPPRGWYVPVGVAIGVERRDVTRATLGGEVGVVHFDPESQRYVGLVVDAAHADGGTTRAVASVELGRRWFGGEVGYAFDVDRRTSGALAGVFATASIVSVTARAGYLDGWLGEVVLAVKLPIGVP